MVSEIVDYPAETLIFASQTLSEVRIWHPHRCQALTIALSYNFTMRIVNPHKRLSVEVR